MKIFGRKNNQERPKVTFDLDQFMPQAMTDAIEKAQAHNPDIEHEATGRDLYNNVMAVLSDVEEKRLQTALGIMGSLAGFSCLLPVYHQFERGEVSLHNTNFTHLAGPAGEKRYFGALINHRLWEGQNSLWSMIKSQAEEMGVSKLPKINDIAMFSAANAHSPKFGVPRLNDDQMPRDLPINFVRHLMPSYVPLLSRYDPSSENYFRSAGFALCKMMLDHKHEMAPETSVEIIMECAVPMASIDPVGVL